MSLVNTKGIPWSAAGICPSHIVAVASALVLQTDDDVMVTGYRLTTEINNTGRIGRR